MMLGDEGRSKDCSLDHEMLSRNHENRELQVILVYFVVVANISLAWFLGYMGISFAWIVLLFILLYVVWRSKVIRLSNEMLDYAHLLAHRKRALRGSETTEWLNFLINRWWVFSSQSLFDLVKRKIDYALMQRKPNVLDSIELVKFTLGEQTPYIKHVRVFEYSEGMPGGRKTASWWNVGQPPRELFKASQYQLVLELDIGLQCQQFAMVFNTRLKNVRMGPQLAVENLSISGTMQLVVCLDMSAPFPHFGRVYGSFVEKPEVWFSLRMLRALQVMEVPLLKSWLHSVVSDSLCSSLVDPGRLDIYLGAEGGDVRPTRTCANQFAEGSLTVTIVGAGQSAPRDLTGNIQICTLKIGSQRRVSQEISDPSRGWQQAFSFLIYDLDRDKLRIKVKSKSLVGIFPVATFELQLSDHPLEVDRVVEIQKASNGITLTVQLEYTALAVIDLEKLNVEVGPVYSNSGIMYVRMHSASNLLALDRSGTSDPYCILFANRKKVKTTNYVCKTCNPKWEVTAEFFVADFTQTILSFFLYDWDGRDVSEDDFLGSAQLQLSKERPSVLYETLELGYNIMNIGKVCNKRFGSLIVSAIFRPVAAVSKSEDFTSQTLSNEEILDMQGKRSASGGSGTSRWRCSSIAKSDKSDSMGVGALLAQGYDILELNLVAGRNLLAKDIGGTSDPFCEVKIGKETLFKTNVVKCTLSPRWDEWVTTRMPKNGEVLDIFVYDKDPIGKDFLGKLTLTVEDLRKLSHKNQADWFPLTRVKRGELLIGCQLIMEEIAGEADGQVMNVFPSLEESETENVFAPENESTLAPSMMDEAGDDSSPEVRRRVKEESSPLQRSLSARSPRARSDNDSFSDKDGMNDGASTLDGNSSKLLSGSQSPPRTRRKFFRSRSLLRFRSPETWGNLRKDRSQSSSVATGSPKSLYGLVGHLAALRKTNELENVQKRSLFIRVRIDNRSEAARRKKPSSGKEIFRTPPFRASQEEQTDINQPFKIDGGDGVLAEAELLIALKSSKNATLSRWELPLADLCLAKPQGSANQRWLPAIGGSPELCFSWWRDTGSPHSLSSRSLSDRLSGKQTWL